MSGAANETKGRVIAAASALFAERGFHGTTARDIARRATVNVAAGHYHFGSKEALYLEVLRAQFADMTATLEARGRTRRRCARCCARASRRCSSCCSDRRSGCTAR